MTKNKIVLIYIYERCIYLWITTYGIMVRVFTNGFGNQGSIPGQVIPKTQKMALDDALLITQHYKVWIKGKCSNPRKDVVPSPNISV